MLTFPSIWPDALVRPRRCRFWRWRKTAEILKVSRTYAAKLFDEGAIPSRRVGTQRRALTSDVLAYKQRETEARLAVLDELAAEGQKLKLGY